MSVTARKRKWTNKGRSGEAWQVDIAFSLADGTPGRRRFNFVGTKPEALDWGRRTEIALRAGLSVPSKHTTTTEEGKEDEGTFEAFTAKFMQTHAIGNKPSERASKASTLRKWLVPQFGTMTLSEISALKIAEFRFYLRDQMKLSPKTVNNILTVLRTILSQAVEFGLIKAAPKVERLKVKEPEIRAFSDEEATALMKHMDLAWRVMLLVALRTGMRHGELRGLRWIDVDLRGRKVHVRQAFAGKVLGSPKGNRSRTIDLSDEAAEALTKHPRYEGSEYVFPGAGGREQKEHEADAPMRAACEAAGITWSAPAGEAGPGRKPRSGRKAGWHSCRHTFISRLVQLGVPLNVVQALAGHVNIKETLRYSHLAPSATKNSVALLDGTKSLAQTTKAKSGKAENRAQA